ncbi:hypothetical protein MKX08_006167 [Trichoderma sp. CBMAI-0020]|nr:hypothetical protein MKX08_006167 [Trichoderma sp. CBMAI-0020]
MSLLVSGSIPQAAFPSGPQITTHMSQNGASPASERRPWDASLAAAASSSSPWSDVMDPSPHAPSPTRPVAIHPLALPLSQPCFSRRHAVFISWSLVKG